jgi:hypothetical protein
MCLCVWHSGGMAEKRKITYEQDLALVRGRKVARSNRRARLAAKEALEQAGRGRSEAEANHVHNFSPGEYVLDYSHSVHECRCGYAVIRPVKL